MRSCNTNVARSLGYIGSSKEEEYGIEMKTVGPMVGQMRSWHAPHMMPNGTYHQSLSSNEEYLRSRRHAECVRREFRL